MQSWTHLGEKKGPSVNEAGDEGHDADNGHDERKRDHRHRQVKQSFAGKQLPKGAANFARRRAASFIHVRQHSESRVGVVVLDLQRGCGSHSWSNGSDPSRRHLSRREKYP